MEEGMYYGNPETITAQDGSISVISAVPRKNTFLEELVALCALSTLFGSVYACILLVLITLTTALLFSSKAAIIALLTPVALILLPDGQVWQAYKRLLLWSMLRRHFSCRLVTPPKADFLQQHGQYLFAEFPHAVYPLGSFLFNFRGCDTADIGMPPSVRMCIGSIWFKIPVLKQIYQWAGCFPADYKPMLAYLQQPGACLSIIPEGFAGIFVMSDASTETIFLSPRKGFIRLALQSGADLVPMYHLGQSQLLDFWGAEKVCRWWRVPVGIFWGANPGLPLPRRHPMIALVGSPLPVKQDCHPSQEAIDALHTQFCSAIRQLFDNHKYLLGPEWAKKELRII